MTISESTVAIIGTGNIGSRLAANFAAGGQDFLLAGRDQEAARKIASDLDGHAEVVSVEEAVERADVLVLAVWFDAFRQLIAQYGERLAGKVIVDPTNPIGPDGNGGYRKVIGEQAPSSSRSAARTSSCRATWRSVRPSRPPISWNTCPPRRRSWPSRRNGGPTAAWRPATCFPPHSNHPRHHRSPGTGKVEYERRLHASRPDPRCHAFVLGLRGLPGSGTPGLGAPAGLPGMRSRRML
jgi:hypothetical protein